MDYIAKIDIGDYKKGNIVPNDIAVVWESMYKTSPVKKVKSNSKPVIKSEKKTEGIVDSIKEKFSSEKKENNGSKK